MRRRDFLGAAAVGVGLAGAGLSFRTWQERGTTAAGPLHATDGFTSERFPMGFPPEFRPDGGLLRAHPGTVDIGSRAGVPAWLLNSTLPSPILRVGRGDQFRLLLRNELPEPFILHWHGLTPPDDMDGHPRLSIPPGGRHEYRFTVEDRAGTYWYHSHAHMRSGQHTYRGIGGLLIVDDPSEQVELPTGTRDLPIVLQDRRLGPDGTPIFQVMGPAGMAGMMGHEPFGNGTHRPFLEVEAALYRLRLLNGSNSRVFRLGRTDARRLLLIGNDAGLLPEAVEVASIDMGPGERVEVLLDLREVRVGDRVRLASLAFDAGSAVAPMGGAGRGGGGGMGRGGPGGGMGMGGMMGGMDLQGEPLDLLEFRVSRRTDDPGTLPSRLPEGPRGPDPATTVRQREFILSSRMMRHDINGMTFQLNRIDLRVPFDQTELWSFVNTSDLPHPVHLHATHFRVLERSGGRNRLFPWESGLKDTVLVLPGETVRVVVRFTAHRGLYLLHCHNLEHEDGGMMLNVLVE